MKNRRERNIRKQVLNLNDGNNLSWEFILVKRYAHWRQTKI